VQLPLGLLPSGSDHALVDLERRPMVLPERLAAEVRSRVNALRRMGDSIDYLSFVPDGGAHP